MMEQWDRDEISRTFHFRATEAKRYCEEIKIKIKSNPSYESVYDQYQAEYHVYDSLHGKLCLSSRDQLLEELHRMLSYEIERYDCYDLDRFKKYRQCCIKHEISQFTNT